MFIKVTQECIDNGLPDEPRACPIALALNKQTGNKWSVGGWFATVGKRIYIDFPDEAIEFIHDFDMGDDVKPFTFKLPL